jgi:hypothetical protein
MNQIILLHDNARLHISLRTREAIATVEWTVFPYPVYNPGLAPSDFHLFDRLKDALQAPHFVDDDDKLKHTVYEDLQHFGKELYATSIQCLMQRWKSVLIMRDTLWKNNFNFVKHIPMMYVNFLIIVVIVSEKKIGVITFILSLVQYTHFYQRFFLQFMKCCSCV